MQKSLHVLDLDELMCGNDAVFNVNALTVGISYQFLSIGKTRLAVAGQWTFYHADERLNRQYGKNPMSAEAYLRRYPGLMNTGMSRKQQVNL